MNMNKKMMKRAEGYLGMILACTAYALSTVLFLAPNSIVAGGT